MEGSALLSILCTLCLARSMGLEIVNVSQDIKGVISDADGLNCTAAHNVESPPSCHWIGPDRSTYVPGKRYGWQGKLQISTLTTDNTTSCQLSISSLSEEDVGVWNCVFSDETSDPNQPIGRYLYISLIQGEQIIRVTENNRAKEGEEVALMCPSTLRLYSPNQRPACMWITPKIKLVHIVGRNGEIFEYSKYSHFGDVDRGDCGILIRNLTEEDRGIWTCRLISKSTGKILERRLNLAVSKRTAPLLALPLSNQVTFTDSFAITDMYQVRHVYWILRREHILQQGSRICIPGVPGCVESTMLILNNDVFNINITFDNFSVEDKTDPLALVVEYLDTGNLDKILNRFVETELQPVVPTLSESQINFPDDTLAILAPPEESQTFIPFDSVTSPSSPGEAEMHVLAPLLVDPQTPISLPEGQTPLESGTQVPQFLIPLNLGISFEDLEMSGFHVPFGCSPPQLCALEDSVLGEGESVMNEELCVTLQCAQGRLTVSRLQNCTLDYVAYDTTEDTLDYGVNERIVISEEIKDD